MKRAAAILALLSLAAPLWAQEYVRLRNGRHITGSIILDESDPDGFRVRLWDSGGVVYIRWDMLADSEVDRLRGAEVEAPAGDLIDGVRITTPDETLFGIIDRIESGILYLKTSRDENPVPIVERVIVEQREVQIPESLVYTAGERLERRETDADRSNPDAVRALGDFARGLAESAEEARPPDWTRAEEMYDRASAYYLEAAALAGDGADALRAQEREMRALAAVARIRDLARRTRYDEAIAGADTFLRDFDGTEVATTHASLRAELESERDSFAANRDALIGPRVVDAYWNVRRRRITEIAREADGIDEAMSEVLDSLDETIFSGLAEEFDATSEEVGRWWANRGEQRRRGSSYGDGTWITRGGQNGGMDLLEIIQEDDPGNGQQGGDMGGLDLGDLQRRLGGGGGGQQQQPQDPATLLGEEIETSEQWWNRQSISTRREWLEAFHAENSPNLEYEEKIGRACRGCRGAGSLETRREGVEVRIACSRCHNMPANEEEDERAADVTIEYW